MSTPTGHAIRRTAGGALVVMGVALFGARALEQSTRGDIDADDPTQSLAYLADHGDAFVITGILLVLLAAALVVAAVSVRAVLGHEKGSLWVDVASVAAFLAAGSLGIAGVMRIAAPGPLAYISSLDADWGDSAYLVVQVAGTQTPFAGGLLGLSLWLLGASVAAWRRRTVVRGALLGAVPAIGFVLAIFGPLLDLPDEIFVLHLFSMVIGLPFGLAIIGAAFLGSGSAHPIFGRPVRQDAGLTRREPAPE